MRAWESVVGLLMTQLVWGADSGALKIVLPRGGNVPYNGLAKKPPMGWAGPRTSDGLLRETADAMVRTGMKDSGYTYVNIADGWQGKRNNRGDLTPGEAFPDVKALADYLHSKGLKLGIYSSPGPKTCNGSAGSFQHEEQDARTFAAWGVDYLTYDWCSAGERYAQESAAAVFAKMGLALLSAGRPVVYAIAGTLPKAAEWAAATGANIWPVETTSDNQVSPGHWNDAGALAVERGGYKEEEYRAQFSMRCILAAPLMVADDLRNLPPGVLNILTNQEAIAVDQDALGAAGTRVKRVGDVELWVKPLADGGSALGLFNRSGSAARVSIGSSDLGIKTLPKVRDLWTHEDRAEAIDTYSADVPAHGVVLLRVGGN